MCLEVCLLDIKLAVNICWAGQVGVECQELRAENLRTRGLQGGDGDSVSGDT